MYKRQVTWFSYVSAEKSLEAQIGEDLDMMALSETSQLESVTGLLRNVLNNGANIARDVYKRQGQT